MSGNALEGGKRTVMPSLAKVSSRLARLLSGFPAAIEDACKAGLGRSRGGAPTTLDYWNFGNSHHRLNFQISGFLKILFLRPGIAKPLAFVRDSVKLDFWASEFLDFRKFDCYWAISMNVTIASFKGGVGKTTTAIHLAAYFQGKGKTALIDGDPNRSATAWAGRGTLPFDVIDEYQIMKVAQGGYRHMIFDTAARPDTQTLKTLVEGCDLLILPTRCETLSLDALVLTIAELQKMKTDKFRVLLTMVPPKPAKDGEITRAAIEEAGLPIFAGSVRSLKAFEKAATAGVIVSEIPDPRARFGWEDYEAIGKEVLR